MKLIDKDAVLAIIEKELSYYKDLEDRGILSEAGIAAYRVIRLLKSDIDTLEVKEVDLYNNGWIDCCERMPVETKQESNTLQGHREWTESEPVLAWDSSYGARIDSTRNGKWRLEQIGGCAGQMIHGIIAWRPIPEFNEELLLKAQIKAQKGEEV